MPYPICSVVAVFKMLIRILNTLPSRIWDMVLFLFSDYAKSTVEQRGMYQKDMTFREIKFERIDTFPLDKPLIFLSLKSWFHLEPTNKKAEILYRIECDVGANKNAGQAFSMPRLSSHSILYKISAFRLFPLTIRI